MLQKREWEMSKEISEEMMCGLKLHAAIKKVSDKWNEKNLPGINHNNQVDNKNNKD